MIAIQDQEFKLLVQYVYSYCGINLKNKKTLVEARLNSLLLEKGFADFSAYHHYLLNDGSGDAIKTFIDRISTNHTYFMREAQHFSYLQNNVLPYLKAVVRSKDLRIWSAGCSSGEEPYTMAMLIDDFFGDEKPLWNTKILATDISSRALKKARDGIYSDEEIRPVPSFWKMRYFQKINRSSNAVLDNLKNEIIFRKFNLMEKRFPFKKKFHVIFCRNVMLYFDNASKRELVNHLYDCTETGGYLFIGQSEVLNRDECRYQYIAPAIYRKR
ncbi:MAG: protein-glutamate O-methyltransferase CheR [Syntrophomonas sp.]